MRTWGEAGWRDLSPELAFAFVTGSPGWGWTCVKAGIFLCIPVVGTLSYLSWERTVFYRYKVGADHIPEVCLDLRSCWGGVSSYLFIGLLSLVAGAPAWLLVAPASPMALPPLAAKGALLAMSLLALPFWAFSLDLRRRGLRDAVAPPQSLRPFFAAAWATPLVMAHLGLWGVALALIGSVGAFAGGLGLLFTLPFSRAVLTVLYAQWDFIVQTRVGKQV